MIPLYSLDVDKAEQAAGLAEHPPAAQQPTADAQTQQSHQPIPQTVQGESAKRQQHQQISCSQHVPQNIGF
jgi:hypothetical protein